MSYVMELDDQYEDGEIKKSFSHKRDASDSSVSLSEVEEGEEEDEEVAEAEELGVEEEEEEGADLLEIKPPQVLYHKSVNFSSRGSRHRIKESADHRISSSSLRRSSNISMNQKKERRHHSRSHKEERRRHHNRDRMPKESSSLLVSSSSKRQRMVKSKVEAFGNATVRTVIRIKEDRYDSRDSHKEDKVAREERYREERIKEERAAKQEEQKRLFDAESRQKIKKNLVLKPEKERERREREKRRNRLLEAERVKEVYRKDTEERRLKRQDRERSRSRDRVESNSAAGEASPVNGKEKRVFRRDEDEYFEGPVVVSDDESPVPPNNHDHSTPEKEKANDLPSSENSRHGNDSSYQSETSSDTDQDDEEDSEEDSSDDNDREKSPSRQISSQPASGVDNADNTNHIDMDIQLKKDTLPPYLPAIQGCRSVEEFLCLNRIAEGTYGVVYRAKDKRTEEIVALKRLKMEKEKEGFPITSLREINTLLKAQHPNIVTVREIVVGSNMDKIFIVMDYVEHDLKSLMETMKLKKQVLIPVEIKCLMQQLLCAVAHLHDNWILHRDLKTSNLLLSHKGILKVGDFGLAREYGSPLKPYTSVVVTLWYRAPELLLSTKQYSTPIDMWSVGCIFAELLSMEPLFPGKSDIDQLNRIFKTLGTPNERIWPGYSKLPNVQKISFSEFPVSQLRNKFSPNLLTDTGLNLLNRFLTYNPAERITAEKALKHEYFEELPHAIDPAMFPTWPAKSEMAHHHRKANSSPKPPSGGRDYKKLGDDTDEGFHMGSVAERSRLNTVGPGFSLKF